MLTPDDKDDGRLRVVIGTRLTLTQYNALRAAYPTMKDGEALRDLVESLRKNDTSFLDDEIARLQSLVREKSAAKQAALDEKRAREQEQEHERKQEEDEEYAKRLRSRQLSLLNGKLSPWIDTAMAEPGADVASAAKRIAEEEGITDESVVRTAIDSAEKALERRRGYRK